MVKVKFNNKTLHAKEGEKLRTVLLREGCNPHNQAPYLSCQGIGSCGTCAIEVIQGTGGPITKMEKWRLRFPPHKNGPTPMRLACQMTIKTDIEIKKWPGFWGSKPKTS